MPIRKKKLLTDKTMYINKSLFCANKEPTQAIAVPMTVKSQGSSTISNHVDASIFSYNSISFSMSVL